MWARVCSSPPVAWSGGDKTSNPLLLVEGLRVEPGVDAGAVLWEPQEVRSTPRHQDDARWRRAECDKKSGLIAEHPEFLRGECRILLAPFQTLAQSFW